MATAEGQRPTARRVNIAFALVAVAAIVGAAVWQRRGSDDPGEPAAVAVDATSTYQFATLDDMVAASDAVVVAEVVATERGRLVGDPAGGGLVSRIVTLRVDRVVLDRGAGTAAAIGSSVIVEEEGWLPDGAPVIVNGVAASEVGDVGVWFLDRLDDAELPTFLTINSQGRFLRSANGSTVGGDQRDGLVLDLQSQGFDELITATAEAAGQRDRLP